MPPKRGILARAVCSVYRRFFGHVVGSGALFIWLSDRPYGIPIGSSVAYTGAILLYTFAANRGMPRYLFRCPIVRQEMSRLARRHAGFLALLILLQTVAIGLKGQLPTWWLNSKGEDMPPFYLALLIAGGVLAFVEIMTNRSVLERAHVAVDPTRDNTAQPTVPSLFNE